MSRQISHADPSQIVQREFDEVLDAKRVVIVGSEMSPFNVQGSSSQEVRIERIEVPQIIVQKELQIVEVEKIIVQKELQIERVEIPVVIEKIVEVIREVPVIQTEVQVIEKPIIIKETQVQELSKIVKVFLAVNSLATLVLLVKLILK